MLIIITGDGKGKTTAAVGQAIRALGQGKKVFFAQFIKSDKFPSGEDEMLKKLKNLTFIKGGKGFVGILGDTLPFAEHEKAAKGTLARARLAASSKLYDLFILDELNVALSLELLNLKEILPFLKSASKKYDLVLTGRAAHPALVALADIVTDCAEIKHPFREKTGAKRGIEY